MVNFDRRILLSWLGRNGFQRLPASKGHIIYRHLPTGHGITIKATGDRMLSDNNTLAIIRQLETCGFDRKELRKELT